MSHNKPFGGDSRKLVLAIDVGTTYSGVAFCVLDPGEVPKVFSVTRYPGQEGENKLRDTKIPTILYYTPEGTVGAAGAEAKSDESRFKEDDEDWVLAQWFKLHLRPNAMQLQGSLPPLPSNVTPFQMLADFLSYIYKCAKEFISDTHPVGRQILQSGGDVDFVLSHPNGWEGGQQSDIRRAAKVKQVFIIVSGMGWPQMAGQGLMIVDAGGGTVDLSTYKITNVSPVTAVESVAPACLLQGSTFVNGRAGKFLEKKLKSSRFDNPEDRQTMMEYFETGTKPTFRDPSKPCSIKFAGLRDTDEKVGIKRGILTLSGAEVASFFDPAVQEIQDAIKTQSANSSAPVSTILLVGGFASSSYLRTKLREWAENAGLTLFCPEGQSAKAVAEGALSSYLDHVVSARVAPFAYGTRCMTPFNPFNAGHKARMNDIVVDCAGSPCLRNYFATLLPKGTLVSEEKEYDHSFCRDSSDPVESISSDITCYRGAISSPEWTDREPELFSTVCTVQADVRHVPKVTRMGPRGLYYHQVFKVVLLFGLTELKAQLSWTENGEEKRSSAMIIYDKPTI
ncbi:uncharacterized protein FIBRA_03072 [Fibroporia radiculosa]|uniref:Uncharacterized protein n=1 Tax=Fibroporia radiculosa TaxID=599839 RepID=J4H273_9APHY|nr:uncharacterized protein FIBRA_03072 [Fibroporia radiculosa]CCM01024.1 predicted protein [Fibroporia radiculosa]